MKHWGNHPLHTLAQWSPQQKSWETALKSEPVECGELGKSQMKLLSSLRKPSLSAVGIHKLQITILNIWLLLYKMPRCSGWWQILALCDDVQWAYLNKESHSHIWGKLLHFLQDNKAELTVNSDSHVTSYLAAEVKFFSLLRPGSSSLTVPGISTQRPAPCWCWGHLLRDLAVTLHEVGSHQLFFLWQGYAAGQSFSFLPVQILEMGVLEYLHCGF